MNYVYYAIDPTDSLAHHGIKDMHWGERRYQNYDGTYTEEGKERRRKGGYRYKNENGSYTEEGLKRRKKINTALAIAGGVGTGIGVTLGTGNGLVGKASGIATGRALKTALDMRAENKKDKNIAIEKAKKEQEQENKYNDELIQKSKQWKSNADAYKKEHIDNLSNGIKKYEEGLSSVLGTKPGKDTMNAVMNASKAFNELDYDMVLFQEMGPMCDAYEKGYIDTKTFKKYYDAAAAKDSLDNLPYGASEDYDWTKRWYNEYNKYLKGKTEEERLNKLFNRQESITHYYYESNYFIY